LAVTGHAVKTKHVIALILVITGTNVFTFATARYWTTKHVLTRAQERMEVALKKEGLHETVYPTDRAQSVPLRLAIPLAGGMYYWWNDGLIYWGAGVVLTIVGILVPFVEPRKSANQALQVTAAPPRN
jgi:hypothetical protein